MFMRLTLHTESSQLICYANQLTGFYMSATRVLNELNSLYEPSWDQIENWRIFRSINLFPRCEKE